MRDATIKIERTLDERPRRRLLATLAVGLLCLASVAGCSDAVCEEAVSTMSDCLSQLNCNNVDPLDRSKCTTAKSRAESWISKIDGLPCVAEASDLAEQINRCKPNPGDFCQCQ